MAESSMHYVCAVSPADRATRAIASVFACGLAWSMTDQPWCAIPVGICSVLLAVGAITGWCPTDLLRSRPTGTLEYNTLGYTDARQDLDLDQLALTDRSLP